MQRQLNDPTEIRRRLTFVIYISCWVATIIFAVLGLTQGQFSHLVISALLAAAGLMIKQMFGEGFDFKRMARSFPFGTPEDALPDTLRQEVESLFQQFDAEEQNWQKRMELRKELATLVKKNPELLDVYPRKILAVNPKLASHIRAK